MAGPLKTFAIDNAGPNPDGSYNVVAGSYCRRILVQEDYDSASSPTADLRQYGPDGSGPVKIAKGTPAVFTKGSTYAPGEVVGRIKTAAGSIVAQQIEGAQI